MNEISNISLKEAAVLLDSSQRILLLCHRHPDGDTLGSAFALSEAQKARGKDVRTVCCDPVPGYLSFLGSTDDLSDGFKPDLIASIDTASSKQLGANEEIYSGKIGLSLDHHRFGEIYSDRYYTDCGAAACGEIVYDLLSLIYENPSDLPKKSLDALYAAISSDTGGFRFENTTPKTLRTAAALVEAGADAAEINRRLFESRSKSEVRAILACYENLRYYGGGKVALVVFSNEIKKKYGLTDEDTGAVNGLPREIEGVSVSITVKQDSDAPENFRISVRSDSTADASEICSRLGGGGHLRAAGASFSAASPEEAASMALAAAGVNI